MFDQLSDRLQSTLSDVRNRGKLTEADVDRAMREIRLALLEADVNFKVVKAFTATVKERCLGADVIHGMRTVFPIPLGEASSFEPALAERTARAAAIEATRDAARAEADIALHCAAMLPPSNAREALLELCVRSVHRSF